MPPLLVDINSDGTEDVIVAMFNSTVIAFDGLTFKQIWNFTIPGSEIISIPIPGYYNDDRIPDLMVKHQIGPGFPVYYYTTATILDGKTGKPLLDQPMEDTLSAQMSGLSVTVAGFGNDWFLHWSADCLDREGVKAGYQFFKDTDPDADLCKLRFNSSLVTSLFAFSQHVEPSGLPLYRSVDWAKLEYNNSVDPRKEAEDFVHSHSDMFNTEDKSSKKPKNRKEDSQETGNYYPRSKNIKYQNPGDAQQGENFLDKALDEMNEDEWKGEDWENDKTKEGNGQSDDNYEYDDEEERLIRSHQLNEIRLQRSEKSSGRYINNDTNDVQNQLDPSMDYTNGQSKQNNYYSALPATNRTSNVEDNADYMNIPDIDFVDNIKDAEALDERRRRDTEAKAASALRHNESEQISYTLDVDSSRKVPSKKSPKHPQRASSTIPDKRPKRGKKLLSSSRKSEKPSGTPRQSPAGILLPSLNQHPPGVGGAAATSRNSVDLVFSTYWLPASKTPFVLLPQDLECVRQAVARSTGRISAEEREAIAISCLENRGVQYQTYEEATDKENARIPLGQMTVYRTELRCVCPEDMLPEQRCKDIARRQSWPQHLGASGSGYFQPLRA